MSESLQIDLLGSFQVHIDGEAAKFRTDALRVLLAYLAAHQGRLIRRDTLASLLAPDRPNKEALTYLRNRLTRLRKSLGEDGATPPYFEADRKQIGMRDGDHIHIDAVEFERAFTTVTQHEHRRLAGCPTCMAHLHDAVALGRGEFLAGLNFPSDIFQSWLINQREHFQQIMLVALAMLCEAHTERGDWAEVIRFAQQQLSAESWHEDAHRAIMQAHFQMGDRSAALAQYEACEKILYEELGVDPEPATLALREQIAAEEPTAAARITADNLPVELGQFFGRSAEKQTLLSKLVDPNYRLLTIVGTGGIGKTRLAVEVGQQVKLNFADGVWFVSLAAGKRGAEPIKIAIGEAMGLGDGSRQLSGDQVLALLRDKQALLIFDNCETVLEDLSFIPDWLRRAPNVAILATSREPLNFQAEAVVSVDGLPTKTAIDLFTNRAKMAQDGFELSAENTPLIEKICQLVDGSPLGIGLAAAWARRRSLAQIVDSISSSIDFLSTRLRDIDPRHRSMRAVLTTSWDLLLPEEQAVLAALSVFPNSFSAAAAQQVADASFFELDVLYEKSLLQQDRESERYHLHSLVRQFSAEKLGGRSAIHQKRFADFYLHVGQTNQDDYSQLKPEWGNFSHGILQAHSLADWQTVLDYVKALDVAWYRQTRFTDMRAALTLAKDAATAAKDDAAIAHVLLRLGEIEMEQNEYELAEPHLNTALGLFLSLEDGRGIAFTKHFIGRITSYKGDDPTALKLFEESLEVFQAEDDPTGISMNLNALAVYHLGQDPTSATAEKMYAQSLALQRGLPPSATLISTLRQFSRLKSKQGDFARAENLLADAKSTADQLNDPASAIYILYDWIYFCRQRQQFERAIAIGFECLEKLSLLGLPRWNGLIKMQIALAYQSYEKPDLALEQLNHCLDILYSKESLNELAFVHYYRATVFEDLGDVEQSRHAKNMAIELNKTLKNAWLTERLV